jgi:uncharacterized membrane protein YebE (DUF533 family)
MIKLAGLGGLRYAGYKYYQSNAEKLSRHGAAATPNAVAGGSLNDNDTVESSTSSSVDR